MENAALIGLSSQIALRNRMDVIANNIANLNTSGFKRESVVFEEYLMPVADMDMATSTDGQMSYVQDIATIQDHSQGPLTQTGNPFDVAINGKGFFVVRTPDGDRYTRNGAFALNANGQLVTSEGQQVLGTGGPLTFEASETDIKIAADGTVSSSAGQKGRLQVVAFDDERFLTPVGASMFQAEDGASSAPADQARLQQGAIEGSNVKPVVEITRMIEVQRAYQTLAQMMARTDEMRRDAIGQLANVPA
ncbi:MAG: flagellar basal-body rod protein FlgF [Rhodobiaceae bacterium]|nr:flagellar basal-body rod protein FlgF [Rhodobiaceae bacterium]MCC0055786.1 flagellar basal-body rod protein FlgF [Rhodobiaceae bacterium]